MYTPKHFQRVKKKACFFFKTKIKLGIKFSDSLEITDVVIFFHKSWFPLAKKLICYSLNVSKCFQSCGIFFNG